MQRVLPLTERVRSALTGALPSADLSALISELKLDLERIRADLISQKAKAVDPLTSMEEADKAREAHHRLGFEEERATSSIARLKTKLAETEDAEDQAERRAAWDAHRAERAALVKELREEYPRLSTKLADLLNRVREHDSRVSEFNSRRPRDAEYLGYIEYEARDYAGPINGVQIVPLINSVRLGHFDPRAGYNTSLYTPGNSFDPGR